MRIWQQWLLSTRGEHLQRKRDRLHRWYRGRSLSKRMCLHCRRERTRLQISMQKISSPQMYRGLSLTMYAIAAYTNVVQFEEGATGTARLTYPGCEASTDFGLGKFRMAFKVNISFRLTKKREPTLSLGCPHPSRRNQVPMGEIATAALILSKIVTDIDATSTKMEQTSGRGVKEKRE